MDRCRLKLWYGSPMRPFIKPKKKAATASFSAIRFRSLLPNRKSRWPLRLPFLRTRVRGSRLTLQSHFGLRQMHHPQRIAGNLMEHRFLPLPESLRLGVRTGSTINDDSLAAEHALDAENVVAIAHGQARMHAVDVHDSGNTTRRLGSIRALGLSDELSIGNTQRLQILTTHHAFGEFGIAAGTTSNDYDWSKPKVVKVGGMVQPGFINRGRPSIILGRTKNNDGIRRARFVPTGLRHNTRVDAGDITRQCEQ